ncbi:cob(I)yrinic acid a,c-diamide adenosyltransferase [Patescibacteria group bacterium]|nr:cob(I)yrinic acid a,c-diamide adenosyltransferase [Patescibacteria group bacterium]
MSNDFGKIHVYTGYGKGKTTAALGLAMRACGRGKKTAIVFFDKGGLNYGERLVLDELKDKIDYYATGRDRIDSPTGKFTLDVEDIDKKEAAKALRIVTGLFNDEVLDLLILDEINNAINLNLINLDEFLQILDNKPKYLELVLTGRDAHPRILERADLVTEMRLIKHYYYKGTEAREGIEY